MKEYNRDYWIANLADDLMHQIGDVFRLRQNNKITPEQLLPKLDALIDEYRPEGDDHYPIMDLIDYERTNEFAPYRLTYLYLVHRAHSTHFGLPSPIKQIAKVIGKSYIETFVLCQGLESVGLIERNHPVKVTRTGQAIKQPFYYQITREEDFRRCWDLPEEMTADEMKDKLEYLTFSIWQCRQSSKKSVFS